MGRLERTQELVMKFAMVAAVLVVEISRSPRIRLVTALGMCARESSPENVYLHNIIGEALPPRSGVAR
eukprot:10648619-Prorocentrum_lima.AAC.1